MPRTFRYATVGAVVLAFVLAALVVAHRARGRRTACSAALDIVSAENRAAVHARAQQLIRALTLLAYGVAARRQHLARPGAVRRRRAAVGSARARRAGRSTHGVNILIILVGGYVVIRAANLAIEHLQYKLGRRHAQTDLEWQRRAGDARRHPDQPGHGRRWRSSRS